MSLSTERPEGSPARSAPEPQAAVAGGTLLTGAAADRCINCNARLALDQRYCVECGTRRGNPRFALAQLAPEREPAHSRAGELAGAAVTRLQLLLGLLLLLVAIGVGVLIGQGAAKAPRVVVSGAGVVAPRSTSGASKSSGSGSGSSSSGASSSSNSQPFSSGS
jgi:uncharacterized membrane protein YgcG